MTHSILVVAQSPSLVRGTSREDCSQCRGGTIASTNDNALALTRLAWDLPRKKAAGEHGCTLPWQHPNTTGTGGGDLRSQNKRQQTMHQHASNVPTRKKILLAHLPLHHCAPTLAFKFPLLWSPNGSDGERYRKLVSYRLARVSERANLNDRSGRNAASASNAHATVAFGKVDSTSARNEPMRPSTNCASHGTQTRRCTRDTPSFVLQRTTQDWSGPPPTHLHCQRAPERSPPFTTASTGIPL